jgi:coproporphyrinogen III oxidase
MTHEIIRYFKELQQQICTALENADGTKNFSNDQWIRPEGGGGLSRVLSDGAIIEKGGVNFSEINGLIPDFLKNESKSRTAKHFLASGVSIVIHPQNPWVPIIHMNVRYFEMDNGCWWFGGGIDLTPHYVIEDQAVWFHQQLKTVCDKYSPDFYPKFKKWADEYFYIKHRKESRGIGGIFFDYLNSENSKLSKSLLFEFIKSVGNSFVPIYTHLITLNKNTPYSDYHKKWQLIRRGRYVEFNLVYDRGTKFGLETNGRIESILMSLPKLASWEYNFIPEPNSLEEKTLTYLSQSYF